MRQIIFGAVLGVLSCFSLLGAAFNVGDICTTRKYALRGLKQLVCITAVLQRSFYIGFIEHSLKEVLLHETWLTKINKRTRRKKKKRIALLRDFLMLSYAIRDINMCTGLNNESFVHDVLPIMPMHWLVGVRRRIS